jgi:hypothetical protein
MADGSEPTNQAEDPSLAEQALGLTHTPEVMQAEPSLAAVGGVWRWDIKTGADGGAAALTGTAPEPTTIASLRQEAAPVPLPNNGRADGNVEHKIWEVTATLVGYKLETDQDYHLVLRDDAGNSMIAEIPDPAAAAGSHFLTEITAARKAFTDQFSLQLQALALEARPGIVAMMVNVSVSVTVRGIGLFDFIHGQVGVAPNGVELHPVVALSFT